MENIRNFCIIAHIDHGKSTLADRMLEITGTIERRKMKEQALDDMELERERGITIKMTPVRMIWHPQLKIADSKSVILNLIDTPGHIDFSYEVSRALSAVEGAVLLIDATQGVEAQTLAVLDMAREQGLVIIPAVSKIDSPLARIEETKREIISLIECQEEEIMETSGRTGEGVEALLKTIIEKVPPPNNADFTQKDAEEASFQRDFASVQRNSANDLQALVFDFEYSTHTGIIVFVRIMQGEVRTRENLIFREAQEKFISLETGIFKPDETPKEFLKTGEIGYITTGIKTPGIVSVGDTIGREKETAPALPGYNVPKPVIWASLFPEDQSDLPLLKRSLAKLKLTDSSLYYEEESFGPPAGGLGKGFRCGFLGMLHLEISTERLKREFNLSLVITQPSITYNVWHKSKNLPADGEKIYSPTLFPEDNLIERVEEPWINAGIITPVKYVGGILPLLYEHEAEVVSTEDFGLTNLPQARSNKTNIKVLMPLRELMRGFFDKLKSISQGYASLSYEKGENRKANVTKLTILIGGEEEPALTKIVSRKTVEKEAEIMVDKLKNLLPRQMFELKIQAKALGRIIASRTISAYRKDVTQHMYGGDITRKMKLWKKQKRGKKKMKERGRISIPQDIFIKIMKPR